MKRYLCIFLGMALLIMTIPCFAFTGAAESSSAVSSSAGSDPTGQAEADVRTFQVYHHTTGTVETIAAADYIKRVVAAEMPASYHVEALKAQAVAAHTYALKIKQQQAVSPDAALKGADISTDPAVHQSYMSIDELKAFYGDQFEANYQKISDAVDAVIDKVIVYDNEPIAAAFHAISGGITEDAANIWGSSLPYLQPVLSDGDLLSPDYETKTVLSSNDVKAKLTASFRDLTFSDDPSDWIIVQTLTDSQSVKEASVCGRTVSGNDLRVALGLNSAYFSVRYANDTFTFDTKGKGHGVGMSQYGADYLARQGKTYDEILKYYYNDVQIAVLQREGAK